MNIRMRELDSAGNMVDPIQLLTELGFQVGSQVERKSDKLRGTVNAATSAGISVSPLDSKKGDVIVAMDKFMKGDWSKFTVKDGPTELNDWHVHSPIFSSEVCFMLARAHVTTEMYKLVLQNNKGWETKLTIIKKPSKALVAKDAIEKDEFYLVPITTNIGIRVPRAPGDTTKTKEKDIPSSAVYIGAVPISKAAHSNVEAWLNQLVTFPKEKTDTHDKVPGFMNPFWVMQSTTKAAEVNIAFQMVQVGTKAEQITIPLAYPSKAIAKGKELKYLESTWPGPPKKIPVPDAASASDAVDGSASKRAKIS